ncbi:2-oxoglutarate-Fe(II)-dependent oxygenase superfamily protein [Motilibacter rhizosphaerae]|uniref:2-oxoglutarate-Fe(II)-dependent oxygenase superfamily protein n=1 Tax=Motilibacter rhizosphaerae TaxID=598652 RepID=A0A4Q7NUG8_9ACTN|nr:2OG-Fe(II) oxygenase [Motilibacter rhizosphaerae]RZS90856.1 2-oxoglutarate-Fe(II)-dependent oxygenase superfamily protein [Motilibacter rhizosphaerae]
MDVAAAQSSTEAAVVLNGTDIPLADLLNPDLVARAASQREQFATAAPYPHIVLDDLFSPVFLDQTLPEFDALQDGGWMEFRNERETTRRSRPQAQFGPATQLYFDLVSSPRFIAFLSELTGITGLVADPLLRGGGMHESRPGGKFDVHLDFAKHPVTQLDNRLTLITYLNHGWQREWGGVLELWDADTGRCAADVVPVFGRTLLFAHTPRSLHGHPVGITPPDGRGRRSLTAYYYTNGRDDEAAAERFTTYFAPKPALTGRERAGEVARAVVPPVLYDAARGLVRRAGRGGN